MNSTSEGTFAEPDCIYIYGALHPDFPLRVNACQPQSVTFFSLCGEEV